MKTLRGTERQRRHFRRWLSLAGAMIFGLSSVVAVPFAKADTDILDLIFQGVRIIQLSNLSDEQEVELGQQVNQQILQEVRVYDNSSIIQYVDGLGQRLVQGTHRPQIPYTFQIIEEDQVNAFATLGGFVYLNTGLLRAADNEAQLASVIAHEIGHVDRRHAIQQLQQAAIAEGVLTAGGLDQNAAISLGVELALHRPNSRVHELEADEVGLALLTQAGYAPRAAVDFLQKLLDQPNATPAFLSTHPHPEARINAINERINPATASTGRGLDGAAYRDRIQALL
ncbi:MAG: M48 family metalloprotease [Leptolyngbya sp. SIO1E4]|nr:M48 family metalloprotease [Leptolyngbya sp. SIO1E4]